MKLPGHLHLAYLANPHQSVSFPYLLNYMKVKVLVHISHVNQYLLAFIETKHDTMCFNLATPLLNLELYIVSEYKHYTKKKHSPWKKSTKSTPAHQKKASHRKKAQKSTTVLLKALAMIPELTLEVSCTTYHDSASKSALTKLTTYFYLMELW